jgi:hypothetical protein
MRLYHFTHSNYALEDIERRRLKIATIDKLNDPFELLGVASEDSDVRRRYRSLKQGLSTSMGLLCFSGSWSSPVQWSHYADHHRGICLGFDINTEVQRIRYVKQRLGANVAALQTEGPAAEAHMVEILSTKFAHWRYEKEYRLFTTLQDPESGLYFYPFSEAVQLREVIVGADSSVSHHQVRQAIGQLQDISVHKARLAFKSFRVVRNRSPDF